MKEFTASDVRAILGIPQRTLDYWDEREVVRPSIRRAKGKGSERRYSYSDLIELSVVLRLRQTGLSLQRIRRGLEYLRAGDPTRRPLRDVVFVTDGKDLFEKRRSGKLVSVLNKQMAISVVFLGRIPDEIDTSIESLKFEREKDAKRRRGRRTKSA